MPVPVYSRVGTLLVDSFRYLTTSTGVPVTGKVQGSFTIQLSKDGVGGQSTAGITITEVSSVTNPGEYSVSILGSAFPAATGHYVLFIVDAGTDVYFWTWDWFITNDGSAGGTIGPSLFTPSAGNGRITNGTSPLVGANITIRTAAGVLFYTAITDVNGLYPPVNFPLGTATYTVYVNLAGYVQATALITTNGSTATGPGADVVLSVSSTTTGFLAQDLWAYARRMAKNAAGSQSNVEIPQAVTDAMERLATAHRWTWYYRYGQLQIHGAYMVGSFACVTGSPVLTLTGGTLPSWAVVTDDVAVVKLKMNNQILEIESANIGAGTVTLTAPWMEATESLTFVLYVDEYVLPANMYKFGLVLPGQRWGYGPMPIGLEQLDDTQNATLYGQKIAEWFAIKQQNLLLSQYPTFDILLRYSYFARPANLINPTDVVDWDPAHLRVLHRAIDVEIAILYGGFAGGTKEDALVNFMEAIASTMANDRTENLEASILGNKGLDYATALWKRRG